MTKKSEQFDFLVICVCGELALLFLIYNRRENYSPFMLAYIAFYLMLACIVWLLSYVDIKLW